MVGRLHVQDLTAVLAQTGAGFVEGLRVRGHKEHGQTPGMHSASAALAKLHLFGVALFFCRDPSEVPLSTGGEMRGTRCVFSLCLLSVVFVLPWRIRSSPPMAG